MKYINNIKFNKTFAIHSAIALILMLAVFFATENGVKSSGLGLFVRKSLICSIVIYLTQLTIKDTFFNKRYLAPLFIMALWYIFPVFKAVCLDFYLPVYLYENEILIGTYGAAALILLQHFCTNYFNKRIAFILSDFLKLTLFAVPLITFIHYCIYGAPIVYEEMLATYNTSLRETLEWIHDFVGIVPSVLIIASLGVFLWCMDKLRSLGIRQRQEIPRNKFLILLVMLGVAFYPTRTLLNTDWVAKYVLAVNYTNDIKNYSAKADGWYNNINFLSDSRISDKPHTVIMVIGESAGRDSIKAYNQEFPYDNSPWLSSCRNNADFVIFENAYGCHSMTQQVLENALTEKSQYNDKEFLDSMNIMDIAKKKGYKTYWLTTLGDTASTYSLIASRADYFLSDVVPYDDGMLKFLDQINPAENNFIVLHGNGSHGKYSNRYPKDREVFHDENVEAEYSNAIIYVDDFLKKVFEYGRDKLNMQVMLYYSDHGENLVTGHGPSDHAFEKVRIPMFAYFGKEYQLNNNDKFNRIKNKREAFFTNDMMYNTFSGMLDAESNYYNPSEDLFSDSYQYNMNTLCSFDRAVILSQDTFLKK